MRNTINGELRKIWCDEIDTNCPYYITSLLEKEELPTFVNKMYCQYYFDMHDEMALMFYFELVNDFDIKDIKSFNEYRKNILNKYRKDTDLWIYTRITRQEK